MQSFKATAQLSLLQPEASTSISSSRCSNNSPATATSRGQQHISSSNRESSKQQQEQQQQANQLLSLPNNKVEEETPHRVDLQGVPRHEVPAACGGALRYVETPLCQGPP